MQVGWFMVGEVLSWSKAVPGILESQPNIYSQLLPSFLRSEIPDETKATCASCAMCAGSPTALDMGTPSKRFFKPETKCCTYHPNLPNYLVGAILSDLSEEARVGREHILNKIRDRAGVTPYGINAPPKYAFLYQNAREFFGRARSMRCPYYMEEAGGLCAIWKYREAVCSTYFCKYVAGADGRKFWMSLKSYLSLVETQLTRYVTMKLDPDYIMDDRHPAEPPTSKLTPEDLEELGPDTKAYSHVWGTWTGLEEEFFKECFRLANELNQKNLEEILGLDGDVALKMLERSHKAAVAPKLPDRLQLNPDLTIKWLRDGSVAIGGYSELDALALPAEAYDMLKEFRGVETTAAVRAKLRTEKQSDFADEILVTLFQHRVLQAAEL